MKKYLPYLLYFVITGLIMKPFLEPGFLFLLDMVWGPQIQIADYFNQGVPHSLPLIYLIKLLSGVLTVACLQKIVLASLLFFSGSNMYGFARKYMPISLASCAGMLYMLNPYVYERFLAGHWYVLAGYAYFPFVLRLFLKYLKKPKQKSFIYLCTACVIYPILSPHWAYMTFWFLAGTAIVKSWRDKKVCLPFNENSLKQVFVFLLSMIIINSYWLFGFWGPQSVFPKITWNDFAAYATQGESFISAGWNVISLYGFWNNINILPRDIIPYWQIITVISIIFTSLGLYRLFKRKELLAYVLAILFIPIVFLAIGYASEISQVVLKVFYYIIPGFKGLRETQKLVGFIAFMYAFLIPLGIEQLFKQKNIKQYFSPRISTFIIVSAIAFFSSFGIFNAFEHQIKAYPYPIGWHQVEEVLKQEQVGRLLVLPWHGYPKLDFAGGVVTANPAQAFFSAQVVMGRNLDNVHLLETEQGEYDKLMSQLVHELSQLEDNLAFLQAQQITHIVLLKISDYDQYEFLVKSSSLKLLFEDESIVLYKIEY